MASSNDTMSSLSNSAAEMARFRYILRMTFCVTYSILFCFGLLNLLVIVAIRRMKRSVTNIYILNLSIADLLCVLFLPLLAVVYMRGAWIDDGRTAFSIGLCKLYTVITESNKYAGVLFLTVLSLDRYLAICQPFKSTKYRTPAIATVSCAVCWFVVAILTIPIVMFSKPKDVGDNRTLCTTVWPHALNQSADPTAFVEVQFVLSAFVFCYLVPVVLIVVFYTLVLQKLHDVSKRSLARNNRQDGHYRRVTYTILAVILCHVICWTPFKVVNVLLLLRVFRPTSFEKQIFFNFVLLLPYMGLALNPILYGLLNPNYRNAFHDILTFCVRGRHADDEVERTRVEATSRMPRASVALDRSTTFDSMVPKQSSDSAEKFNLLVQQEETNGAVMNADEAAKAKPVKAGAKQRKARFEKCDYESVVFELT